MDRKKILITGGAGFIGSHLTKKLLQEGNEVTVLDNLFTGGKSNIYQFQDDPKFTFLLHDVTNSFWGRFDEIYNLACPASPIHYQKNPIETIKTSFMGTLNVLELGLKTSAKILHVSTSEIYGDPLEHPQKESQWGNVNPIGSRSCYDEGKRSAESLCYDYIKEYGVDVRIARVFNTYGPNMHHKDGRVVSNFINQVLNGEDITIYGDGSQTRSFQYVDDLVEGLIKYMRLDKKTMNSKFEELNWDNIPVLNLGNPNEFTIGELANKVVEMINKDSKIKYLPLPSDDPKRRNPDISFAKYVLNWEPKILLDEGLSYTIDYFKKEIENG